MVDIKRQKVVIIGHSSTLRLGIVRALAELECEITVIVMAGYWRCTKILKTLKPFDCYSKYISHVYYCYAGEESGLMDLLFDKCKDAGQKVILIPVNDFSTVVIDNNKDRLKDFFLFPHITKSPASTHYWMDKEHQKELARSIGIDVPDACVVNIRNKSYKIPVNITYPCFTKALVSIVGGKNCFYRCDSREELCKVLDIIGAKQDVDVLVEDYKEIEHEYAVLGFSNGKEVIIPGIVHILALSGSHFGVARTGKIIPIEGYEELLEQYKSFVLQMGFVGVFDIDFYYSGGKFYFGEMNLRPGGSGYAATKLGVNLPAMLVRYFRGEDIADMRKQIKVTASFVNERMCEDDWYSGNITLKRYHQIISSAEISFVKEKKDCNPLRIFKAEHCLRRVKKVSRKYFKSWS